VTCNYRNSYNALNLLHSNNRDSVPQKYMSGVFILESRRPINTVVLRVSVSDSRVPANERETHYAATLVCSDLMERRGRVSSLLLRVTEPLGYSLGSEMVCAARASSCVSSAHPRK
jgi:hypothetical protein